MVLCHTLAGGQLVGIVVHAQIQVVVRGQPVPVHGSHQVHRGAPAIGQTPPRHVHADRIPLFCGLGEPCKCLSLVGGQPMATQQPVPQRSLCIGMAQGGGGLQPLRCRA